MVRRPLLLTPEARLTTTTLARKLTQPVPQRIEEPVTPVVQDPRYKGLERMVPRLARITKPIFGYNG